MLSCLDGAHGCTRDVFVGLSLTSTCIYYVLTCSHLMASFMGEMLQSNGTGNNLCLGQPWGSHRIKLEMVQLKCLLYEYNIMHSVFEHNGKKMVLKRKGYNL